MFKPLVWLFRALLFLALFAFALNNQQPAAVNWFFGQAWQAPMILIVLAAFGLGAVVGVTAMLPSSWTRWRQKGRLAPHAPSPVITPPIMPTPSESVLLDGSDTLASLPPSTSLNEALLTDARR